MNIETNLCKCEVYPLNSDLLLVKTSGGLTCMSTTTFIKRVVETIMNGGATND